MSDHFQPALKWFGIFILLIWLEQSQCCTWLGLGSTGDQYISSPKLISAIFNSNLNACLVQSHLWFGLASRIWKLMMATILGTDLDSARHKLRVSDEKQDSHPKLEAKSPPESLPPVWDTFCQVNFSYTSYGFVIFLCSISSLQQSATLSGWLEMIVHMKMHSLGFSKL